jgi:hypothetical protein
MSELLNFCGNTLCSLRVWNLVKAAPEENSDYTNKKAVATAKLSQYSRKIHLHSYYVW